MATLWTLGHSTRDLATLAGMLTEAGIARVADVRRFPGSRRHPQFGAGALADALAAVGVAYVSMSALGGRRTARPDSRNTAWRNAGFRGYADYMDTDPYRQARDGLAAFAREAPTAVLCAEAMWWQCHRSLIADDFKAHGWEVIHLMAPGRTQSHPWSAAARLVDGRLDYGDPADGQGVLFES
ncbi:DUF488 family protein [Luteimonas abyssi]|uniref:DUF488 domain-containing protein n=1 Tax=Luteimonas abyssi TaxID=1247514 RepID=UPI000737AE2D|nr:DUF488 domain-containing protein [Luteimonas abyssi]